MDDEKYEVDNVGFDEMLLCRLVFVSPASMDRYVTLLQTPWEESFGVELQVDYC